MSGARGDLVFVGDVHLDRDDPELESFQTMLDGLAADAAHVVLMGDLFNLWLGRPELEQPHQQAVVRRLAALRVRGVRVDYVEGNRDYRIGPAHEGDAFDRVATDELALEHGGRRILAVHGDLANPRDRQYRAWRRLSRARAVWALFNLVPRARRLAWALAIETRMRTTNARFRAAFPERDVRRYAERFEDDGHELVVLGHFHLERRIALGGGGEAIVLPEWKAARRVLVVDAAGDVRFVERS